MALHLFDVLQLDPGQDHKVLLDRQIGLAGYLQTTVLQNAVIGNDASCNGVLDGHHPVIGLAVFDHASHIAEGGAGQRFGLPAEVAVSYDLMETSFISLYGDFHMVVILKNPGLRLLRPGFISFVRLFLSIH